jgi:hypothetical protein
LRHQEGAQGKTLKAKLLLGFAAVLVLAAGWLCFIWPTPHNHNINAEGFEQLSLGMTEKEVETVLGVPAGDYGFGDWKITGRGARNLSFFSDGEEKDWIANLFTITICFDAQGRVRGMARCETSSAYDSPLETVSQWMGLSPKKSCEIILCEIEVFGENSIISHGVSACYSTPEP